MAEQKVTDLPVITDLEFTPNDRFLIVDDGKVRQLSRNTLQTWIQTNVQGEKGEQGFAGIDGIDGARGKDGINGKDGLSEYQIAVSQGYVGTVTAWLESRKGAKGEKGLDGGLGWTPALKTVARDDDIVLQLFDWIGGTGTKPTLLGYIGDTGIVTNLNNATNIRGIKGDTGLTGEAGLTGDTGTNGVDGKSVESLSVNDDLSTKLTFTDQTFITSTLPPKKTGWATYKDTLYTLSSAYTIPISTQIVIPNNALENIEKLPTGITTFYNDVTQKYQMIDPNGFYNIRVRFKAIADASSGFINLSMSKDTTETPYSEDRALRGDSTIQDFSFSTELYGDTALSTNGLTIRIKTYDRAVSIYNIEVMIAKVI